MARCKRSVCCCVTDITRRLGLRHFADVRRRKTHQVPPRRRFSATAWDHDPRPLRRVCVFQQYNTVPVLLQSQSRRNYCIPGLRVCGHTATTRTTSPTRALRQSADLHRSFLTLRKGLTQPLTNAQPSPLALSTL